VIPGGPAAGPKPEATARPAPFEEVLIAHLDGLFSFALRLTGGRRERAEDLVQEACLRAFRNYEGLRAPEKVKSWLFQILVNTHINEFHRQRREPPMVDVELSDALLESARAEPVPTPEEGLFERLLDT
jgi:RNA polymerase sigma-70 factor (ECF subfamily)